jgi:hypothetical protein
MKSIFKTYLIILLATASGTVYSQDGRQLQFFRPADKGGLNIFEAPKADTVAFDGIKVRIGGDFAMQFQSLNQSNDLNNLVELGTNFNLPTANLNIDVQLYDGVRMHLRTYLSSRHHNEAWIKGGHLQMDKLDFIKPGFMEGLMKYTTITIGLDEFNYGDAHFRRSDNARALYNPFVGNYIMDAFATEAFGEFTFQKDGGLLVLGITNGKLNQSVALNENSDNKISFYGKLGYDKQLNEDLRVRLTGSWYINNGATTGTWLYGGDRAGARYYFVMLTEGENAANVFTHPRFNARFTKITALQFNPFVKFKGLEFFGIYEVANGNNEIGNNTEGAFTQIGAELLYRFGTTEQFYLGARYNTVSGKRFESQQNTLDIDRINVGGGWFMTKNILTKIEYVKQNYAGSAWTDRFAGAMFSGINVEAVIGF